jgi:8-oxo-dGTP pyrophosphatase MutT (NUDIX family)
LASVPVARTAARAFVLDPHNRLLLVLERRDVGSAATIWLTPGGGVEPGESLVAAAQREVHEETGLRLEVPVRAEPIYSERVQFPMQGRTYDQTNFYFPARVEHAVAISPAGHTELEKLVVLGHRWWTLDDLDVATADREPIAMVAIVRRALEQGLWP